MTLPPSICQLAQQEDIYWVVLSSESAVGALCTYQGGSRYCAGIHNQYAHPWSGRPRAAINILVTVAYWITAIISE